MADSRKHRKSVTPIKTGGERIEGPEVEWDEATRRKLEAFFRECDLSQAAARAGAQFYMVMR